MKQENNMDYRPPAPTPEQIEAARKDIESMDRESMCQLWRHAPSGHPYFDRTLPYYAMFEKRFDELGRFSPAISKAIG